MKSPARNHKPNRSSRVPTYRERIGYGQAIVTLTDARTKKRKDYWLGEMNTPESRERYHRVIAEWEAAGRCLPATMASTPGSASSRCARDGRCRTTNAITVGELILKYWQWAKGYYSGSELSSLRVALRILRKFFGSTPGIEFGPNRLRLVREDMVRGDLEDLQGMGRTPRPPWSRKHTNGQVHRIGAMFKWAAAHELLPVTVYQSLKSVPALKRGRSEARESEPVGPVAVENVDAVRPYLSRQVKALIDLQLLTGARGGELLKLRPVDIVMDEPGGIWTVLVTEHKTAHHGHARMLYLGPKAQAVITPFLIDRRLDAYLFSPAEAEQERLSSRSAARATPLSCGNRPGANRVEWRARPPRDHYTAATYRRAIQRACERAFPVPAEFSATQARRWRVEHAWHPHQLRHTAATRIRKEFGLEAARIALGHSSALVTDAVYAERDRDKVAEVMRRIG